MKTVSLLITCYNEAASLPSLYHALKELMDSHNLYKWEVLMVNDASTDDTLRIIKELRA